MPQPNIILITLHDMGDFLPCYGTATVPTPNIDRLAREGVVFVNHFAAASVCSPSRGTIMTGCYPHTNGLTGLVHRGWALDVDRCPTLPMLLRQAGYRTLLAGGQHEHHDVPRLGYEQWLGSDASPNAETVMPTMAAWLRSPEAQTRPFFAAVGTTETHRDGLNPSGWTRDVYPRIDPASVQVPPFLPDCPEVRGELAQFYGAIAHTDRCLGVLLEALDATGLASNTLLVFTTDHGLSIIHAKATLFDGGIKVACIMRWPAGLPAGRRCQALTSHVDMLPTLLEAAGLPAPDHVQGRSALDLIAGRRTDGCEHVFAEMDFTNYFVPTRVVRSRRMKYIRKGSRYGVFDYLIPEVELSRTDFRRVPAVYDFYDHRRAVEDLYDLARDPGELRNVIDDPAYAAELASLRAALDAHLEATDDPFRHFRNAIHMPADGYVRLDAARKRKTA
jgi:arylsulfatase A-like enzyme